MTRLQLLNTVVAIALLLVASTANAQVTPVTGDIDGDGVVNANDLALLLNHQNGTRPLTPSEIPLADVSPLNGGVNPGDGIIDSSDVTVFSDGLANPDLDGDGLGPAAEQGVGSSPFLVDTDSDGLDDGTEVSIGTDPLLTDSDGDGLDDGVEVANGLDPTDAASGNMPPNASSFTVLVRKAEEMSGTMSACVDPDGLPNGSCAGSVVAVPMGQPCGASQIGASSSPTSSTWKITGLSQGTTYTLYAVADDGLHSTCSTAQNHTTNVPPNPPTFAVTQHLRAKLTGTFTACIDPDAPNSACSVRVIAVSHGQSCSAPEQGTPTQLTSSSWEITGLLGATTYTLYAVADDGNDKTCSLPEDHTTNKGPEQPAEPGVPQGSDTILKGTLSNGTCNDIDAFPESSTCTRVVAAYPGGTACGYTAQGQIENQCTCFDPSVGPSPIAPVAVSNVLQPDETLWTITGLQPGTQYVLATEATDTDITNCSSAIQPTATTNTKHTLRRFTVDPQDQNIPAGQDNVTGAAGTWRVRTVVAASSSALTDIWVFTGDFDPSASSSKDPLDPDFEWIEAGARDSVTPRPDGTVGYHFFTGMKPQGTGLYQEQTFRINASQILVPTVGQNYDFHIFSCLYGGPGCPLGAPPLKFMACINSNQCLLWDITTNPRVNTFDIGHESKDPADQIDRTYVSSAEYRYHGNYGQKGIFKQDFKLGTNTDLQDCGTSDKTKFRHWRNSGTATTTCN